jgi:hypothetical protein
MRLIELFESLESKGGWTNGLLDTQYKVVDRILLLQQTKGAFDWAMNLFAAPMKAVIPYKDMPESYQVHAGFFIPYKVNADEIAKLDFDRVAGYSRGSGEAIHLHEDFLFNGRPLRKAILFGCPRTIRRASDAVLSRWDNALRVSCPHDIVTHVAPRWMGYQHVGDELVLGGIATKPKNRNWAYWLSGHSSEEYIQRLAGDTRDIEEL